MGMATHTPDQLREQIEIGQPTCKCGFRFFVFKHTTTRKKKFLGITANCENVDCENHEPIIAHDEAEMIGILMSKST